jgi:hypothetical protein
LDSVRAIALDAGSHRIEFFYRPASVYWGLGLTLAGLLAAAFLACRTEWSQSRLGRW